MAISHRRMISKEMQSVNDHVLSSRALKRSMASCRISNVSGIVEGVGGIQQSDPVK